MHSHNVRFNTTLSNTDRGLNSANKFNRICFKDNVKRDEFEENCNSIYETNQFTKQYPSITFELQPTELNRFFTWI